VSYTIQHVLFYLHSCFSSYKTYLLSGARTGDHLHQSTVGLELLTFCTKGGNATTPPPKPPNDCCYFFWRFGQNADFSSLTPSSVAWEWSKLVFWQNSWTLHLNNNNNLKHNSYNRHRIFKFRSLLLNTPLK